MLHPDDHGVPKRFFEMYFNNDLNPHFFNHPGMIIYAPFILNLLVLAVSPFFGYSVDYFVTNMAVLLAIDKIITVIFSTLTVLFVYKIGKLVWDKKTGLLSALVITFSVAHLVNSYYVTVDVPVTFFSVLTFYYFVKLIKEPRNRGNYLKIGASIGLAISTKYNALLLLPFYVFVLLFYLGKKSIIFLKNKKVYLRKEVLVNFILSLLITLTVFAIINPFVFLSFDEFYEDFTYEISRVRSVGDMSIVPSEHFWSYNLIYALLPGFSIFGLTLLFSSFFVVKRDKYFHLFLLWVLSVYFINESFTDKSPRYVLPLFPMAGLLMGRAVAVKKNLNFLLIGMGLIVLVFLFQLYPETRLKALEWMKSNQGENIYSCAYSSPFAYTTSLASGCAPVPDYLNNKPAYYLISENHYQRCVLATNPEGVERCVFYDYVVSNGELVEEFSVLFTFGFSLNPKVSVYYLE